MTERLSQEQLNSILDAGHRSFARLENKSDRIIEGLFPRLNLKSIISSPEPKKQIQSLAPQVLLHALLHAGLSDCMEVLPLLTQEQFVRICDYDIWHEDRLVPKQAFHWLSFYRELSPAQMHERFRQLDEEYQIALLSPFCAVFTKDEYEKMTEQQQDLLYRFPNDSLFYSINTGDPELHKGICSLVDAAMSEDMSYAFSLLSAAAFSPPNEQEELIRQFRNARLEEDGFISYEESLSFFIPINPEENFTLKSDESPRASALTNKAETAPNFLTGVLQHLRNTNQDSQSLNIQSALLHLSNAICAAAKVEPDDLTGLKDVLKHTSGLVSFSLETLSAGDLPQAAFILCKHHPKKLFQWGLGLVNQLREGVLESISKCNSIPTILAEKLRANAQNQKFGHCQEILDKDFLEILGLEHTEVLKALFNRFPLTPEKVIKEDKKHYIAFKPITSFADFKALIAHCEALSSKLQLASSACAQVKPSKTNLDTHIVKGLLQLSLGKPFISKDPDQQELEQFRRIQPKPLEEFRSEISTQLLKQESWITHPQGGFVRSKLVHQSALSIKALEDLADLYKHLLSIHTQTGRSTADLFANQAPIALKNGSTTTPQAQGRDI